VHRQVVTPRDSAHSAGRETDGCCIRRHRSRTTLRAGITDVAEPSDSIQCGWEIRQGFSGGNQQKLILARRISVASDARSEHRKGRLAIDHRSFDAASEEMSVKLAISTRISSRTLGRRTKPTDHRHQYHGVGSLCLFAVADALAQNGAGSPFGSRSHAD
jgi:hypothetical protein